MLDHDARSYELISRVFAGHPGGPHARRRPRQHHALLVDEHGDFFGPSLLGKQGQRIFDVKGVSIPVAVSVFPDELYPGPAELGRAGVSQTHLLQQARQRRALCGLGTAATLFRRGSRGLQITAQIGVRTTFSLCNATWAKLG